MRRHAAPRPQDQIAIVQGRARRKTRHNNAGAALGDQIVSNLPSGHCFTLTAQQFPRTGQLRQCNLRRITHVGVAQIQDIVTHHPVATDSLRLRLERKTLLRFQPGGIDAQRRVETRHSNPVEAAAMQACTLT